MANEHHPITDFLITAGIQKAVVIRDSAKLLEIETETGLNRFCVTLVGAR
jgi:hypothetical protein